ncbi:MAG: hypothetical protein F6K13_19985 [Okeania sp. SIO2B9]|nr:hypothetical protein [Okeania sp. SIO2B9]
MFNLIANFFKSESEASFISILLMLSVAVDTGEFKLLAIKLNIPELPEKIKENRPYKDINELAVKEVISPQQLDFVKNDITVAKPTPVPEEN